MKTWILLLVLLPAFALAEDSRETDHAQLRQLMADAAAAIEARDAGALRALLAREFVVTLVDQGRMTSEAEVEHFFEAYFNGPDAPLKRMQVQPEADAPSRFLADDVAVAWGHSVDRYTLANDEVVTIPARWTATLQRQEGRWKIAAFHAGVNLLDNPVLAEAQNSLFKAAVAGAVAGGLMALLLVSLFRKRA